jgi:flavorubredoxin
MQVCLAFLSNFMHTDFKQQAVKGGDKIDLGGGHVLEFVMAPNLHWPDTMFSYDHATRVMYTCDAFGMHYCSDDPYDSELAPLEPHYRFYYDCLMLPNAKSGACVWGGGGRPMQSSSPGRAGCRACTHAAAHPAPLAPQ